MAHAADTGEAPTWRLHAQCILRRCNRRGSRRPSLVHEAFEGRACPHQGMQCQRPASARPLCRRGSRGSGGGGSKCGCFRDFHAFHAKAAAAQRLAQAWCAWARPLHSDNAHQQQRPHADRCLVPDELAAPLDCAWTNGPSWLRWNSAFGGLCLRAGKMPPGAAQQWYWAGRRRQASRDGFWSSCLNWHRFSCHPAEPRHVRGDFGISACHRQLGDALPKTFAYWANFEFRLHSRCFGSNAGFHVAPQRQSQQM